MTQRIDPTPMQKSIVTLIPMSDEYSEMVRNWRNDPDIAQYAINQQTISKEQHQNWFERLGESENYYFVIKVDEEPVGLTFLNSFKESPRSCESGIYIVPPRYRNGSLGYQVVTCLLDFAFDHVGIELMNAWVLRSNRRAIRFNEKLGYSRCDSQNDDGSLLFRLTPEDHRSHNREFKEFVTRSSNFLVERPSPVTQRQ